MTPLRLSVACGDYDINRALIDGEVRPGGMELTTITCPSPQRHWRMIRHREFDVCELSMASYLALNEREPGSLVAIPVFPHRRFRHGFIFVNGAAGVQEPSDLDGRRVGLRTWQTTAGLWARGLLQDEYGIDLRRIDWYAQDDEDIPIPLVPGLRLQTVPQGKTVTAMIEQGELDALIYPETPSVIRTGDPRVRRLFPSPKEAEIDYYRRTGLFPIMHTVVVRRDILEQYPWATRSLLLAFRDSKDLAVKRMADPRRTSLAWVREALEEQERILGPDPWCYDFSGNRATLETMVRYAYEQGLTSTTFPAEELFADSTLDELPHYV